MLCCSLNNQTGLSGNAIILSVLYYGGMMVTESSLTAGQLSAFLLYAAYVTVSLSGLSSCYSEMMKGLGASTRLWQLVDKAPEIPVSGGGVISPDRFQGAVQFRDLTFSYPTRPDVPIFQNLSLDIPAGSVTAVVGSSGSGKSTLAALLLRFYDPHEVNFELTIDIYYFKKIDQSMRRSNCFRLFGLQGKVLVDGHSVTDLDPQWLRAHIGTVSQVGTD